MDSLQTTPHAGFPEDFVGNFIPAEPLRLKTSPRNLHHLLQSAGPHGHGLSFKKGLTDGLFERIDYADSLPNGHDKSYKRCVTEGADLRRTTALRVRPEAL
jgi:hypothetical protein